MVTQCPACKKLYDIDEAYKCQCYACRCGKNFLAVEYIPQKPRPKEITPQYKKCPMCGEIILYDAKKCKFCGEYLDIQIRMQNKVNRGIYTILCLLFGFIGIHNFYAGHGEELAGVGHIICNILSFVMLCIWGYGAIPAICVVTLSNVIWCLYEICRGPECYHNK